MKPDEKIKAVCLLSGGLDSSLALGIMKEEGVEVLAVNFTGPFGGCQDAEDSAAKKVADSFGVPLLVVTFGEEYLDIVRHPAHGYGSNVNPCIDCHIYMLRLAGEVMRREGAAFLVTGEVLGQRPMSQRLDTLKRIEKESGLKGFILRPLSARLLEETVPEARGWVRRERMLGISGRSRREQIGLARETGLEGFSAPAGGCLLTDPQFAGRVRDLIAHGSLNLHDAGLLRFGRHFRLPSGAKLVVGRHEHDNQALLSRARPTDTVLFTVDCPGPTAVISGPASEGDADLAAQMVARYSDGRITGRVAVRTTSSGEERTREVAPLDAEEVKGMMI